MTLANELSQSLLTKIQDHFDLEEVHGEEGGAYLPLPCPIPGVPPGSCRVFKGEQIPLMVYVGAGVPMAQLDSHMIFAFTQPESLIPHFTLDAIKMGDQFAFHLDMIPRADLGANLEYLNEVFQPITGTYTDACAIEGLSAAQLEPRQMALMSPWMLAYRATESAFRAISGPVDQYVRYWAKLMDDGLSAEVVEATDTSDLAGRDQRNRAAIFNPDVDPVWAKMERMIGADKCEFLQRLLRGEVEV